ncbi:hypothetical protein JL193_13410 [Polaribacter batillariae]|uniref:DUF5675 domain-containing protein n=1 Tax=Polaribacter batillariae TaxID=2808900 RepID=A0ABX7SS77_9FLAO|nr:DUF5675 family protein [Polaribacter batillariae]QTD37105.1 hypothetical protein JL193_13410 [Polaribacter batillariae]
MELTIERSYFKEGTNGVLFVNGKFLGFTIELPWIDNLKNKSCIPEGRYILKVRFSEKFKNHLVLENVNQRTLILIHSANHAKTELRGCIAPVTYLTGIGKGIYSRDTMQKLMSLVYQAQNRKEKITLTIKSQNYENYRSLSKTNS